MRQLLMHLSDLGGLPDQSSLPLGLNARIAVHADAESLASLLAAAFADDAWTVERVGTSLLDAADVRTTYVVLAGRDSVATASVQVTGGDTGYIHWVAVHPDWQGRRLGRFVCLNVLQEFARLKFAGVLLKTDDQRLAAIKTYADLGFAGVIHDDIDRERWHKVAQTIPGITTRDESKTGENAGA